MAAARGDAALYRWVNELGVTHYTTDLESIPSSAREDALEIVATPPPEASTRALPVPPAAAVAPAPPSTPAPEVAPPSTPQPEAAPAPVPAPETPPVEAGPRPQAAPSESNGTPPVFPGPPAAAEIPAGDPRAAEVAELEARIAADREQLRRMISTKRWDSAELASSPEIREIAERLPRLQAELAALRAETVQ